MTPWQKFAIGSIAIALLSSSTYYEAHPGAPVIAIIFATVGALGSYFWGLVSPNPFRQDDKNGAIQPQGSGNRGAGSPKP